MITLDLFKWLVDVGPWGLLVITYALLFYGFAKQYIVPGFYHQELIKDGDEALKLLPAVNEELAELKTLAAVQKVRDEYGLKDREELSRRLGECLSDLGRCRDRERERQ
jgi:hypothetical protein